ncbi:hypothetical protein GOBAR_AA34649 [Gossypium barbadense]|uniref:Uncharacterized protein n=1 Tax=Gossypium barbadense TaxID=3634 RepID=A0A2P5W4P0_GOSBA|nr:hypothetical protein GOBAR_AA34649 [Gossypium barbadense]
MLIKFISVSESYFQNTEIVLKNQQASIQGLETQVGQLSKLISERPQGSLPSSTEPNPREQLNVINIQDDERVVEPELERRQETVVSRGQGEVGHNKNKSVNVEYKPRVPYPNATRKDRSDELYALSQMPNTMKFLKELLANKRKSDEASHVELNAVWLEIEELDEWRTHKLRTPDKSKLRQNELNTFLNQLKVGDRVLLDAADPHIVTTTPNEEIPLTVISIFPFGTVELSHPKFDTFKIEFCLNGLVCRLSVPEFGTALGLYMEEFKEENDLHALNRHIHRSPSRCWDALVPGGATYNPSRSKASALPLSLRYLHAILAHTIIGRTEKPTLLNIVSPNHTKEEAYKDILDDVPPQHEDPPTQPPAPSRPVHVTASYADISERLTRFEQQCFQRFDNIDATLQ